MFSRIGRRSRNGGEAKVIEIDHDDNLRSVTFFDDGKSFVSGGIQGRIRHWQVEDGAEVEAPMDAGGTINNIAVSRDGKWIVSGTGHHRVTVWNAGQRSKAKEVKGHSSWTYATDISLDARRFVTGSQDGTVCIWSLPDSRRLLGPIKLPDHVVAVKFSPDGRLIATATWKHVSVQIYDSRTACCLVDLQICVGSSLNQSLAWGHDSKRLFVLSVDGNIHCLDASSGDTLSKWRIPNSDNSKCIALPSNGAFVVASAGSSVSFWDTTTHKRIGPVLRHSTDVVSMAISKNYDIVIGGDKKIILRNLCDVVPSSYYEGMVREQEIQRLRVERARVEESLRAQEGSASSKIAHLENAVQNLRIELTNSHRMTKRKVDTLTETIESLKTKDESSNSKITHLEQTVEDLRTQLADCQRMADEKDNHINALHAALRAHEQQHHCEALYADGRIHDAAASIIKIANSGNEVRVTMRINEWVTEFTRRCVSSLEGIGDKAEDRDQALAAYSTTLSLDPLNPTILSKWIRIMLTRGSVNETLGVAAEFELPRVLVYQAICDVLESDDHVTEAIEFFGQMQNEISGDPGTQAEQAAWQLDFRARCVGKLEKSGDAAMNSRNPDAAIGCYSDALSFGPTNPSEILVKRSKARAIMGSWEEALADADKIIEFDPSFYKGYEKKHAALHGMGRYNEAFGAFSVMLSKLEQSPDPHIRNHRHQYVDATSTIRRVIEKTIRGLPRVLIDTSTGRLHDKTEQAAAFEQLPIYDEMRSSMVTQLDDTSIEREVKKFYRYVMFSHRWDSDEPLFQTVEHISIYDLKGSFANIKLQTLCSIVHSLGFRWVWSDTCCINKKDHVVLQESLVAMFTWYRGSSLTIVYLRGIFSHSQKPGDLRKSIWNTRAWTYQEYVASETVRFYTEDWKPYLGLEVFNHKESYAIISEMEQASSVSAQELAVLRPGFERVREKLFLASMRQTTLAEDIAYSLLGIFNVAIPVIYGEGERAVGRFLEHILTGSGDVTILAWTGHSGSYNSCLPPDLTVYSQLVPPHISQLVETTNMERIVMKLRSSSPDLSLVGTLYNRLHNLPPPSVAASRLCLPGIVFPVTELVRDPEPDTVTNLHVYRATTSALGDVEIKTTDDLTEMNNPCLVYPWIRTLFDQEFLDGAAGLDETMKMLRLVARLRQPFGALLFTPVSRIEHRRVAVDALVMAQVCEGTSLSELIDNIQTIDIH